MKSLLDEIRKCRICQSHVAHELRPIVQAHKKSKIAIIGQAPGRRVHESGIPWQDPSGDRLREWLGFSHEIFYNEKLIALVPMGFCYPGKGKSGDLPPRPECAPQWHSKILNNLPELQLTLLIGQYAQKYYLKKKWKKSLTQTVKNFREYLPDFLPLPHPSPRNIGWFKNNPWFEKELLQELKSIVHETLMQGQ